jgi:hypothetical protein
MKDVRFCFKEYNKIIDPHRTCPNQPGFQNTGAHHGKLIVLAENASFVKNILEHTVFNFWECNNLTRRLKV